MIHKAKLIAKRKVKPRLFTFDHLFSMGSTNSDIFFKINAPPSEILQNFASAFVDS